jgi:Fur family ferric uptake transcriptional regulator
MLGITRPVTHAEVATALGKRGLDRVSVYRVLVDLARVKVLTRADMGDHVWRFGVATGEREHAREHPHFVCETCGAVECLPDHAVRLASRGAVPRAVKAGRVEVQVKGECDACAAS